MTVYEAAVHRLATLGYEATEDDRAELTYLIGACEKDLLADINHRVLPEALSDTLADMAAGQFLHDKKATGGLAGVEGFDFPAPAKSISEGDVSVTFAGSSDGTSSAEERFDALLDRLRHPPAHVLAAYRRLRW